MSKAAPFPILNDDPIPARTYAPRGARGSIYPLEQTVEGQSFLVAVTDAKKAAQKRSYLSALGKSRGIKIKTVFYPEGKPGATGKWKGQPTVQCWNMGAREPDAQDDPNFLPDLEDGQDEAE